MHADLAICHRVAPWLATVVDSDAPFLARLDNDFDFDGTALAVFVDIDRSTFRAFRYRAEPDQPRGIVHLTVNEVGAFRFAQRPDIATADSGHIAFHKGAHA